MCVLRLYSGARFVLFVVVFFYSSPHCCLARDPSHWFCLCRARQEKGQPRRGDGEEATSREARGDNRKEQARRIRREGGREGGRLGTQSRCLINTAPMTSAAEGWRSGDTALPVCYVTFVKAFTIERRVFKAPLMKGKREESPNQVPPNPSPDRILPSTEVRIQRDYISALAREHLGILPGGVVVTIGWGERAAAAAASGLSPFPQNCCLTNTLG